MDNRSSDQSSVVDGGGIRSYSSLLILEELMKRIRSIAEDVKPTSDNTKGIFLAF